MAYSKEAMAAYVTINPLLGYAEIYFDRMVEVGIKQEKLDELFALFQEKYQEYHDDEDAYDDCEAALAAAHHVGIGASVYLGGIVKNIRKDPTSPDSVNLALSLLTDTPRNERQPLRSVS